MKKNGFALLMAIFIMVVFSLLGALAVSIVSNENIRAANELQSVQALHLAEGAYNYAFASYFEAPRWNDNPAIAVDISRNFGVGAFRVNATTTSRYSATFHLQGTVGNVTHEIAIKVNKTGFPRMFDSMLYAYNGSGLTLGGAGEHVDCYDGSFVYNGILTMKGDSKYRISVRPDCAPGEFEFRDNTNKIAMYSIPPFYIESSATCDKWKDISERLNFVTPIAFDDSFYTTLFSQNFARTPDYLGDLIITTPFNIHDKAIFQGHNDDTYIVSGNINIKGGTIIGPGTLVSQSGNILINDQGKLDNSIPNPDAHTPNLQLVAANSIVNSGDVDTPFLKFFAMNDIQLSQLNWMNPDGRGQVVTHPDSCFALAYSQNGNIYLNFQGDVFSGSVIAPNGTVYLNGGVPDDPGPPYYKSAGLWGLVFAKYLYMDSGSFSVQGSIVVKDVLKLNMNSMTSEPMFAPPYPNSIFIDNFAIGSIYPGMIPAGFGMFDNVTSQQNQLWNWSESTKYFSLF